MRRYLCLLLALFVPCPAQDIALLNLRVSEGEGATYATGSRATRGITVEITDELARPVSGATVSFVLPDTRPTGVFTNGGRTEVAISSAEGRASVWGMQWDKAAGDVEVRITAAKGSVRAGTVVRIHLAEAAPGASREGSSHRLRNYLIIAGAVVAAAAAGAALGGHGSEASSAAPTPSAPVIGAPAVSIGRP